MVENKGLIGLAFGRHCSEHLSGEFREPVLERESQVFLKGEPQPLSLQDEYHTLCVQNKCSQVLGLLRDCSQVLGLLCKCSQILGLLSECSQVLSLLC